MCDLGHSFIAVGKWFQELKVYMNESYIAALLEVLRTAVQFVLHVSQQMSLVVFRLL